MNMTEWAEREVELACKREKPDRKEGEWDYGCACYESALKAYKSMADDGHSGYSWGLTSYILTRLLNNRPLTPIEDTDDVWNDGYVNVDGIKVQQCLRMSSLFKEVHSDGTITYDDIDRVVCVDINNQCNTYTNGFIRNLINEQYPIVMPYMPATKNYKVYVEEFLVDPKHGDYDTMGVLSMVTPEGETIYINRYFTESENGGFEEIDEAAYNVLKRRKI